MEVDFKNVGFQAGESTILNDVSFNVSSGGARVIIGASGSGKTTILRLMVGLLKPTSGQVLLRDKNINSLGIAELNDIRRRIAIVFQHGALFDSVSVQENVGYRLIEEAQLSRKEIDEIVYQSLCFVGLPDVGKKMPGELSGGMRKRVAIARALASGAELILFDEPTSGLDPINAVNITRLILELKDRQEFSTVVVTHDLQLAFQVASRIVMLSSGSVVFEGTVGEMWDSQDQRVVNFISPGEDQEIGVCELDTLISNAKRRLESDR